MNDRSVIEIQGQDRIKFLQNLVTNDVSKLAQGPIYAAILTPQGKYLADFILVALSETVMMDVHRDLAPELLKRLNMYRLRADVQLTLSDNVVSCGQTNPPQGAITDPRHAQMGWRYYGTDDRSHPNIDWDALRIELGIPEYPNDLGPDSYILEMGFERLNGVDFKKGCYVGQEVTARMKHKTVLRKGLRQVKISGSAPIGTAILANEKPAGVLYTQQGGLALAYLRFDRIAPEMVAGSAIITP